MTRRGLVALVLAGALALAGCAALGGSPGPVPGIDGRMDLGSPGDKIGTYDGVRFYPACGNETLAYEGKVWFPFRPANPEDFPMAGAVADDATAAAHGLTGSGAAAGPGTVTASVGMVVAPGPGDDVGTLTVYERDFAHWVSESGYLVTWRTNTKIEYGWAC